MAGVGLRQGQSPGRGGAVAGAGPWQDEDVEGGAMTGVGPWRGGGAEPLCVKMPF